MSMFGQGALISKVTLFVVIHIPVSVMSAVINCMMSVSACCDWKYLRGLRSGAGILQHLRVRAGLAGVSDLNFSPFSPDFSPRFLEKILLILVLKTSPGTPRLDRIRRLRNPPRVLHAGARLLHGCCMILTRDSLTWNLNSCPSHKLLLFR